jgi:alkylation response protein AidB-like acyl-CoA dehydrogenase
MSPEEARFVAEVRAWLQTHLDPDLAERVDPQLPADPKQRAARLAAARAWQRELAEARFVGIDWPVAYGGRGGTPIEAALFAAEYARHGGPQLVNRVGLSHAGPTILAHGTEEQKRRYLPAILTADELWCQLFSEPDAGSDLASLSTRAKPKAGGWRLVGRKVWTSYADVADLGLCLVRSVPDSTGPSGLSVFVVPMRAEGVEVRPLVQATGEAEFNEVILDGVLVGPDALIGAEGDGWRVASTTLAFERGVNFALKEEALHERYARTLFALAAQRGAFDDPTVADALADGLVALAVLRGLNWRTLSRVRRGSLPGPETSAVKLAWTIMTMQLSEAALSILGEEALLWGEWQRQWLWSRAASIAGGTSEIQRNVIAERLLGLPREPR